MAEDRTAFDNACKVFEARLTESIGRIVDEFPFQATMLTAIAIDVLADTSMNRGPAEAEDYIKTIEDLLPDYKPYARRFYRTVRCGLVHRCQLTDAKQAGDKDEDLEGPSTLSTPGNAPPRLSSDKLVIDVKHLVESFFAAYEQFKRNPFGPRQRNFAKRMTQTVYDETPTGLVEQGSTAVAESKIQDKDESVRNLLDELRNST